MTFAKAHALLPNGRGDIGLFVLSRVRLRSTPFVGALVEGFVSTNKKV